MFRAGDDLLLQCFAQVAEIVTVSSHTDDETAILLRVLLGSAQSGGIHHIELNVMPIELEVRPHQLDQFIQPFVRGEYLGRELLIEQCTACAGMIHFGH